MLKSYKKLSLREKKKPHFLVPVCPLSLFSRCLFFSVFLPQIVLLTVRAWHAAETTIKVLKVGLRPRTRIDDEKKPPSAAAEHALSC